MTHLYFSNVVYVLLLALLAVLPLVVLLAFRERLRKGLISDERYRQYLGRAGVFVLMFPVAKIVQLLEVLPVVTRKQFWSVDPVMAGAMSVLTMIGIALLIESASKDEPAKFVPFAARFRKR